MSKVIGYIENLRYRIIKKFNEYGAISSLKNHLQKILLLLTFYISKIMPGSELLRKSSNSPNIDRKKIEKNKHKLYLAESLYFLTG